MVAQLCVLCYSTARSKKVDSMQKMNRERLKERPKERPGKKSDKAVLGIHKRMAALKAAPLLRHESIFFTENSVTDMLFLLRSALMLFV